MDKYLQKTLMENWRREMKAAHLYQVSAEKEKDARRKEILKRLAEVEYKHAQLWVDKLAEYGVEVQPESVPMPAAPTGDVVELMQQIEAVEQGNDAWYQSQRNVLDQPDILSILDIIDEDEKQHHSLDDLFQAPASPGKKLKRIWGDERWHKRESGGWVGDAIYGVNDGLGAIFGIIAGVAGYTNQNTEILISGMFGALASTLSMGAGAYLAAKSENELMESELASERREILENPDHEREELALLYELKGFEAAEAERIASQISSDPDVFMKTMAQEELGIHETSASNPWQSAIFGAASTLVGAVIPLIPFFFMQGAIALIVAAAISILAHFVVGALKSRITVRSWWVSGLEMTLVGVIVGGVSYALGEIGRILLVH
ncbi:VIT1/CCC1 transporter family protein [Alicyclobacillus sp. SP_1]|uniref:VIT1/CCC1 transporter family protein n=1 Tax=Alicyclobacillus sp. SP_1 TaxID=2942475 RepID=UPI00215893F5|nr:VIT1/CCC1 transporter family protein [Alicyclobacillus sp. SP_1]